jgi:myosin heavy subunit
MNSSLLLTGSCILGEEMKDGTAHDASSTAFASSFDKLGYEPHIYEVSALAYRGLARDRKDQVILVSGESGAGKTETVKIVLQHLATLEQSAPKKESKQDVAALGDLVRRAVGIGKAKTTSEQSAPKRERTQDSEAFGKLVRRVVVSAPLFEAFGNAKTLNNLNSSRFGKVTRLQFAIQPDNICSLQGSTYETCLLETSRVVAHGAGERSFHIFYQLLAAPRDVKISLLGSGWAETTAADFAFLSQSSDGCLAGGVSDTDSWERTMRALKFFEWRGNSLQALVQALGIILRLGNLTFKDTEEGVAVTSLTALEQVADSMGIAPNTVEHALTHRIIKMSQDQVAVPLNAESAKDACDALVKKIYEIIFDAVVQSVNMQTNAPNDSEGHGTVSLVDIFGFESFEVNRFEQLCVNYVNEKIQHRYVEDNLRRCKAEYKKEGIELLDYKLIDNTPILDLLEGRSGIISALNEESFRPNGSNEVRTTTLCRTFVPMCYSFRILTRPTLLHYPIFAPLGVCLQDQESSRIQ